jgi:heat shock protein HslJ
LSLETLAGTEWVLRAWDWSEPAPAVPEVTLQFRDGRFAGTSGCNRYSAAATAGNAPGDLTLGPAAGTRMACPEPQMAMESRFLAQLPRVQKFGFMAGELVLHFEKDGGTGTMFFAGRPLAP